MAGHVLMVVKFKKPPAKRGVGRPHSGKIMVNLRLDPEVVAKFKATGPGWQARINEALLAARAPSRR